MDWGGISEGYEGDWGYGVEPTEPSDESFNVYANLTGLSGIDAYQRRPAGNTIAVMWKNSGTISAYPWLDQLESLAERGWGLNRTINAMR